MGGFRSFQHNISPCFSYHAQCDYLIDITWVDANGTVHISDRRSDEGRAICGGIGLLGVITELTLQLTPSTNTRLSTWLKVRDGNLVEDVEKLLKVCR